MWAFEYHIVFQLMNFVQSYLCKMKLITLRIVYNIRTCITKWVYIGILARPQSKNSFRPFIFSSPDLTALNRLHLLCGLSVIILICLIIQTMRLMVELCPARKMVLDLILFIFLYLSSYFGQTQKATNPFCNRSPYMYQLKASGLLLTL